MRPRVLLVALVAALAGTALGVAPVAAQQGGASLSDLDRALGGSTPTSPDGAAGATSPSLTPADPAPTTPASGEAVAGTTPTPPSYLQPGPGAARMPVSSVASLVAPELPTEPARLAVLIALTLAALALAGATATRAAGLRTGASARRVVGPPSGRAARARERGVRIADDLRDFLRHRR